MATTFTKQITPKDGNWLVTIGIASKDPADVDLAQKYGDIDLDFSGSHIDNVTPDPTYSFSIPSNAEALWSDILLNKLPNITYNYSFNDASVLSTTRYRQALIFVKAVETALTTALTNLRDMPATPPVNTTFIV